MSSSATGIGKDKRGYRLGKRARKQLETRRRIVEAAVDLHCTVGPARTTISQIAERAGVQRHTYYAHFPDERSLFLECSALAMERGPLPDIEQLLILEPGAERVRRGLELFYAWFEQNADHAANVMRDARHHQLTREMVDLRMKPTFLRATEIMGEGLADRSRAILDVALDFACWQTLGVAYTPARAAALMADAVSRVA